VVTVTGVAQLFGGTAAVQETIEVDDILVAAIGDSYGSGEGNPDTVVTSQVAFDRKLLIQELRKRLPNEPAILIVGAVNEFEAAPVYHRTYRADDGQTVWRRQYVSGTFPFVYMPGPGTCPCPSWTSRS